MTTKKTIILSSIAVAVAALVLWYFLWYRKTENDPLAAQAYSQMEALFNEYIPGGIPFWLKADAAKGRLSNSYTDYYLVNGKITAAGALLAAYDAEYHGYGYEYTHGKGEAGKEDEKRLQNDLHAIWQQFKKAAIKI